MPVDDDKTGVVGGWRWRQKVFKNGRSLGSEVSLPDATFGQSTTTQDLIRDAGKSREPDATSNSSTDHSATTTCLAA